MSRCRRRALKLTVAVALFATASEAEDARPLLVLAAEDEAGAGAGLDLERLVAVLEVHLAELAVAPRIDRPGPLPVAFSERVEAVTRRAVEANAAGAVWIDSAPGTEVYLFVLDHGEGRVVTWSIEEGASSEDRLQTIALLVESSIGPLVPEREVRPLGERPRPSPAPRAPPGPGPVALEVGYGVVVLEGDRTVQHGPSAGASVHLPGPFSAALLVWFGTSVPVPIEETASVERLSFRPGARLRLGGERIWGRIGVGPTADLAFASAPRSATTANVGAAAEVAVAVGFGRSFHVSLGVGADYWFTRHFYTPVRGDPSVLQFARLQPRGALHVGVQLP